MFEDLIPELQGPASDLVQAAGEAGLLPRVTSTRRTQAAQERLYRRWQSGLSPFPAAPPGSSSHEFGFAFDMVCSPFEALADVGATWISWGGVWGGTRDPVHFEYPGFVVPTPTIQQPSWWEEIVAGFPIGLWPSFILDALGIPSLAIKDINPVQEEILRKIALQIKTK